MPYKDKGKQRKAGKERTRHYRDKQKGVTPKGVTDEGVTQAHALRHDKVKLQALAESVRAVNNPDLPSDDELFAGLPDALRIYANSEQGGIQYRQLIHYLMITPIEQLQAEGRPFIPGWRYNME